MFQIIIFVINLEIRIGFLDYFECFFFKLPVRILVIKLRIWICFISLYKTHSDISYISNQVRIGFFGFGLGSDYHFYAMLNLNEENMIVKLFCFLEAWVKI